MLEILQFILKLLAKKILRKYNPEIIGITGSVGKTSAKRAVGAVLSAKFSVGAGAKNYNNELGVPLAIIGAEAAGKNIFRWLGIFWRALGLILLEHKNYPGILILEMAADKPGDMDYLLDFAKPRIGILTRIGPVHLERFGTQEKILQEKSKLIKALPKDGVAILNYDYKDVLSVAGETKAKSITYGFDEGADVRAKNMIFGRGQTTFTLEYGEKNISMILMRAVGKPHIYAILAGAAAGLAKGMALEEIKEAAKNYEPQKGRGNLAKGIRDTLIIDETYNASPQAVEAALENLKNLSAGGRSIAVLGDMLELGPISRDAHLGIGKKARELQIDYLFTVGARAKDIARGAEAAGMNKDRIYEFADNAGLGKFLQEKLEPGDTVLIKGSRGMRMEEIIQEIIEK